MPAGLISQSSVVCRLELNGYAIEPSMTAGAADPACANSTQNLPTHHTHPTRTGGGLVAPIAS